jgi:hypothetical protein
MAGQCNRFAGAASDAGFEIIILSIRLTIRPQYDELVYTYAAA